MARTRFCLLTLAVGAAFVGGCTSPTVKPPTQQTFADKVTASVKSGTSKLAAAVTPKKALPEAPGTPFNDKPGPGVFVAVAEMHEHAGKFEEAEANYRKALELDPKHLEALVGYARLEDRRSNFEAATRQYRKAIAAHPKSASVHNDLGLCYHRRGLLAEATRELKRAVELEGENKLYRNNLAAVYVEQDKGGEALAHLKAAHGTSVAHYNLGYLLLKKGNRQEALYHFQAAANMDRNLIAAQQWVARLSGPYAQQAGAVAQTPHGPYAPHPGGPAYVAQRPGYSGAPQAPGAPYGQPPQPPQYVPSR